MGSTWGKKLNISIFGESHGEAVGAVIDGFPHGFVIDFDNIKKAMNQRKPGMHSIKSSSREEDDIVNIISGTKDGVTTGAPICIVIKNTDYNSKDYESILNTPRPSTADLTAGIRFESFNDINGAGHLSGRLTAPLVAAGAICRQFLDEKYNVKIYSEIEEIGDLNLRNLCDSAGLNGQLTDNDIEEIIKEKIDEVHDDGDSVGGKIMLVAENVRAGLGNPIFGNVESELASVLFAVPAVKSVSFGLGEEFSKRRGSEVNDVPIFSETDGKNMCDGSRCGEETIDMSRILRKTNNCGGIEGGITTGMDIVAHVVFKPTPSIRKTQQTINIKTGETTEITIKGRHDPCIAIRGRYALEAGMAIAIADMYLQDDRG